ncbi:hypothetical protein AVEN_32185-1 [Araneus ventricosus]|uniref:Uncharacterized protein n=1 Tax=Araneus ventricosus TaxID=182803 RepID=A0A4Y2GIW2_ARAVE|nr:hypothetical protein AVEN_156577-1 [Araneus ventricosus]GBM52526.1 hypothetical protein AVEN_202173-1 [Araneus ventricosus]GBM52936.1 hypothetical protein AVEN_248148-1 [Araneus ventricosus]GBM53000.1 hypothetical protein AVEN_32185-1 [Araneus ventricosus]
MIAELDSSLQFNSTWDENLSNKTKKRSSLQQESDPSNKQVVRLVGLPALQILISRSRCVHLGCPLVREMSVSRTFYVTRTTGIPSDVIATGTGRTPLPPEEQSIPEEFLPDAILDAALRKKAKGCSSL